MFKRNRFKKESENLILYPDYGNIKGFFFVSIFCLLFCYALYSVNNEHNNIGVTNIFYIITGTLLLLLLGFATAFKKVIFDDKSQSLKVVFFGIKLNEILFTEILKVEELSPSAFYIILKKNHLGKSVRLSSIYNQYQQNEKIEFYHKILPIINDYFTTVIINENLNEKISFSHFKQKSPYIYQYISIQKILFSLASFILSSFLFLLAYNYIFKGGHITFAIFALIIFLIICCFMYLIIAINNFSMTVINTKRKLLIQKSLLGISLAELPFNQIENIQIIDTQINGLKVYTNLCITMKNKTITIEKNVFSQRISDIHKELTILLKKIN